MNEVSVEGAIAFTDLVGFTEYTATRGDQDALAVLGAQDVIVRAALPASARVVKELGDGLLPVLPRLRGRGRRVHCDPRRLRAGRDRRRDAVVGAGGAPLGPTDDGALEFVELGPVMMKGIPDPIDLYRVERVDLVGRDAPAVAGSS